MKAKTVGIVAGAGLLGASALAASKGKSMHERCKEAFVRATAKGSCGPAACRKQAELHAG